MAEPDTKNGNTPVRVLKKASTNIGDNFQVVLNWIDYNILPLIATPALAVFTAAYFYNELPKLSQGVRLGVAIAIAAILTVKTHDKKA